jgi:hypothetical protein
MAESLETLKILWVVIFFLFSVILFFIWSKILLITKKLDSLSHLVSEIETIGSEAPEEQQEKETAQTEE